MALKQKEKDDAPVGDVDTAIQDASDTVQVGDLVSEDHDTTELTTIGAQAAPSTAVVVAAPGNAIANAIAKFKEQYGEDAIDLDFTSFPILKLEKRNFELNNGSRVGDELQVVLAEWKPKFLFQSAHAGQKDREVCYSYDKNADTTDPDIMDVIKKWKDEENVGYSTKKYFEVLAIMHDDDKNGDMNGQIVTIQIPPKSCSKFSGYVISQDAAGRAMGTYVTVVSAAAKEVGHGSTAFYPWEFRYSHMLGQEPPSKG